MIGGALYALLDHRLGSLASSDEVSGLPPVLEKPLSEPLFVLGVLFILVVFFVPGGIARIGRLGRRPRTLQRLQESLGSPPEAS